MKKSELRQLIKEEITRVINESNEDEIPLTTKVKKYIDRVIKDAKNDDEFENLINVGFFDNEIIDNIINDLYPDDDYDRVSKEIKDYIEKAII
jgi:hypothetical protein